MLLTLLEEQHSVCMILNYSFATSALQVVVSFL